MTEFKKLLQLHEDFTITLAAFNAARHETKDMISATSERLQMEKDLAASRAAELEQTANDPDRSDTVRRVAAVELEKIRKQRVAATPEEQAAVKELILQQQAAIHDLYKIETATREAIRSVNIRVEEIRNDVLRFDIKLRETWIPGQEKEFARLCEEVPVYDQAGV